MATKTKLYQPAEWAPQTSCWVAWPSHGDLWKEELEPARAEFTALCRLIGDGQRLDVLVPDRDNEALAREALKGLNAHFHSIAFGDIWLRDTAPIFLTDGADIAAVRFLFNGWGGKYVLPHDADVSASISTVSGIPTRSFAWVLEGGSVEVDGEGTCLTTKQCLLNPNRNPGMTQERLEQGLKESLGVTKVLWLDEGLINDHTDGHIDTLARFVSPGVVVCMKASSPSDPNVETLERIAADLSRFTDAKGRPLKVIRVPSPGKLLSDEGEIMPASYVNFYIANKAVAVPTYGLPNDAAAVEAIARCFPGRKTVGLSALSILNGGGAFHCITQQQPEEGK